jgi:hypothetical protein
MNLLRYKQGYEFTVTNTALGRRIDPNAVRVQSELGS